MAECPGIQGVGENKFKSLIQNSGVFQSRISETATETPNYHIKPYFWEFFLSLSGFDLSVSEYNCLCPG